MSVTSTPIRTNVGGCPVLVMRPDASRPGTLSVNLLTTFNRARTEGGAACVLAPSFAANEALLALVPADVTRVSGRGVSGAWLRTRWWAAATARNISCRLARASGSFWVEWHRELRRHAGDERLPSDLRTRLRESARRSLARSAAIRGAVTPFPRRQLRDRMQMSLEPGRLARVSEVAGAAGITGDRPLVALEMPHRRDALFEAIDWLVNEGYCVVRVGAAIDPIRRTGLIDPRSSSNDRRLLELFVLLRSRFVVCGSLEWQQTAYLTNTPSLLLNATDPFSGYPIRNDSLFTLSTVVDLDTGRTLTIRDRLDQRSFRNVRNYGFRDNAAAEVLSAIQEMHEGLTRGWQERETQSQFRERVTEAGRMLAAHVPFVAEWGPADGFIGDGRLARWQADDMMSVQ